MSTEILVLDELAQSQGNPEVTHNAALRQLEGRLVRALDKDLTVAPSTPAAGDVYIVATGATGTWSGKDKKIAHYWGGSWKYYDPKHGYSIMVTDENRRYFYNGTVWGLEPAGAIADGDYGDVSVSGSGTVITVDVGAISYAKMQDVSATSRLLGRVSSGAGDVEEIVLDADGALAANSAIRVPTQSAIVTYVDSRITGGASDVMIFKGVIDCSANPNYPAADAGHLYKVSVAGKIGGASGPNVEAGDTLYCITDSTASGNHATVGANWAITQVNIDGAVTGPASVTNLNLCQFDGTTGKLIKEISVSGALDIIGSTRGTILYRGASGWAALAVGTDGQVLTTHGAGADPTWESQPFDMHMMLPKTQSEASQVVYRGKVARAVSFADDFAGSQFTASANATGSTVFDVQKNGSSIGSVTIGAGGVTATFATTGGAVSFAAGDIFSLIGPASADATLANAAFTFAGTR